MSALIMDILYTGQELGSEWDNREQRRVKAGDIIVSETILSGWASE